jgi:hypothetical protein
MKPYPTRPIFKIFFAIFKHLLLSALGFQLSASRLYRDKLAAHCAACSVS